MDRKGRVLNRTQWCDFFFAPSCFILIVIILFAYLSHFNDPDQTNSNITQK